jgi:SPX domain protein involved in polyphosphate accumulation
LLPGARFLEGSDTASFELRQKQIEGQAFLDAFQTLKGGGQINEKEGEKATAAISRMNKAASEVEYVQAARELQEVLREGVKRAKAKAARGGAGAPLPKNKWASALAEFEAQENQ